MGGTVPAYLAVPQLYGAVKAVRKRFIALLQQTERVECLFLLPQSPVDCPTQAPRLKYLSQRSSTIFGLQQQ